MNDQLSTDVRTALRAEASAVAIPEDLAERTVEAARTSPPPQQSLRRVTRFLPLAAAAAAVLLIWGAFGVGRMTIDRGGVDQLTTGARTADDSAATRATGGLQQFSESAQLGTGVARPAAPAPDAAAPADALPSVQAGDGTAIVRTAELEIRVPAGRFGALWARANAVAGRFGGFVSESSAETNGNRLDRGTLTMRVPADRLDAARAALRDLGTVVREASVASDVSEQLVDRDARLRSLRAQEAQLLELLGEARGVSQVLEVRARLDEVRTQVETTQAQRDRLQSQVDLATLTAHLFEPDARPAGVPGGRLAQAWRAAADAFLTVVSGMVVMVGAIAPIVLVAVIALVVWRLARRRPAI